MDFLYHICPAYLAPKYTFELHQHTPYTQEVLFTNLSAPNLLYWSLLAHYLLLSRPIKYHQTSPYRFRIYLEWPYTHVNPNALRYVLCAVNRAKGTSIFISPPEEFEFLVQVYEIVLLLQIQPFISPLYGKTRQFIRNRSLTPRELVEMWNCVFELDRDTFEYAIRDTAKRLLEDRMSETHQSFWAGFRQPDVVFGGSADVQAYLRWAIEDEGGVVDIGSVGEIAGVMMQEDQDSGGEVANSDEETPIYTPEKEKEANSTEVEEANHTETEEEGDTKVDGADDAKVEKAENNDTLGYMWCRRSSI